MVALQLDRMMTEETKKKLSQALKGRKLTEEHKRNISKAKKGVKFTEEHKRNISKAKVTYIKAEESTAMAASERAITCYLVYQSSYTITRILFE